MPRVMLVDDDETMTSLLQTFLQFEGFEVALPGVDDSFAAILESIRREQPDLVLLDINLRRFSGFDLLHALRQDSELHPTRVLMSSGMDYAMRCYQEGADAFLLKPYMPEELIGKIWQTIEKSPE